MESMTSNTYQITKLMMNKRRYSTDIFFRHFNCIQTNTLSHEKNYLVISFSQFK